MHCQHSQPSGSWCSAFPRHLHAVPHECEIYVTLTSLKKKKRSLAQSSKTPTAQLQKWFKWFWKIKDGEIFITVGSLKSQPFDCLFSLLSPTLRPNMGSSLSWHLLSFLPFLKIIPHASIAFLDICFWFDKCDRNNNQLLEMKPRKRTNAHVWSFPSVYQTAAAFTSVDLPLLMESSLRARRLPFWHGLLLHVLALVGSPSAQRSYGPLALAACQGILATCQSQFQQQVIWRLDCEQS